MTDPIIIVSRRHVKMSGHRIRPSKNVTVIIRFGKTELCFVSKPLKTEASYLKKAKRLINKVLYDYELYFES